MKTLSKLFLFALVAATFAACDSNPVDENHDHEHTLTDIHHLELIKSGEVITALEDQNIVSEQDTIFVPEGDATALITLHAEAEDGDEIHLDELGDEYFLSYDQEALADTIAAFEQHEGERWSFHLHGEGEAGETAQLSLWFMHNPADPHADYKTVPIPVKVTRGEGDHDHDHDHDHNMVISE